MREAPSLWLAPLPRFARVPLPTSGHSQSPNARREARGKVLSCKSVQQSTSPRTKEGAKTR